MQRAIAGAAAALVAAALAPGAGAATYKVTKRTDPAPGSCLPNDCSLREAVRAANARPGSDKVVLPLAKVYQLSIAGVDEGGAMTGDLDITNDPLRIVHPGKGEATIDAGGLDRIFEVFVGAPATLENLVIRNGLVGGLSGNGGGIAAYEKVTLLGSTVTGNRAGICGGGIHMAGPSALLVMRGSKVTKNKADWDGGGISASCAGNAGAVSIRNSAVSGNRADLNGDGTGRGGGIYLQTASGRQSEILRSTFAKNRAGSEGGGIYTDLGRLRLEASTVNGNRARLGGGGISVDGTDPLLMVNSTVAGNKSASNGGGIYADGGSVVRLNAVTVVRNRGNTDGMFSEAGGGLAADLPAGDFVVQNSLIVLNVLTPLVVGAPDVKNDCSSVEPFTSLGHNLLSTRHLCHGFTKPSDRARANPKLGQLKANGGPTKTVALLAKSPALNKAGASAPARDQRGKKRGKKPDIGAYEKR
jgi:predicted outer membrane repeat protein